MKLRIGRWIQKGVGEDHSNFLDEKLHTGETNYDKQCMLHSTENFLLQI